MFSYDCSNAICDWGVEASEAIRVTETGSELFCNMSKELHIK